MKSAIGEGMTRRDHSDVSNQLVSPHTVSASYCTCSNFHVPMCVCVCVCVVCVLCHREGRAGHEGSGGGGGSDSWRPALSGVSYQVWEELHLPRCSGADHSCCIHIQASRWQTLKWMREGWSNLMRRCHQKLKYCNFCSAMEFTVRFDVIPQMPHARRKHVWSGQWEADYFGTVDGFTTAWKPTEMSYERLIRGNSQHTADCLWGNLNFM